MPRLALMAWRFPNHHHHIRPRGQEAPWGLIYLPGCEGVRCATTKGVFAGSKGDEVNRGRVKFLANRHLWLVTALFAIAFVLQYPDQLHLTTSPSLFSFLGLTRHAFERILLIVPIGYAIAVFGLGSGFVCLGIAAAIMLPRVFLLSQYPADALVETAGVLVVGAVANVWFHAYRKDRENWKKTASDLDTAYQQLESRAHVSEEHQKRLSVLNSITAGMSESLELSQILDRAIDAMFDTMGVDGAWIYLMNPDDRELVLSAHRGITERLPRISLGYGLSGRVAESRGPSVIQNPAGDPKGDNPEVRELPSVLIVPVRSKGQVTGTVGISSRMRGAFQSDEVGLLSAIGYAIGVAVENARLYKRQQEIAGELRKSEQRYRELFENAHDAILVHDLQGNVIAANKAAEELTGYGAGELLKKNMRDLLDEESLAASSEIGSRLLVGDKVEQPYAQRLIRRGGGEALLKLTTNLLNQEGRPSGFLHIARDVTIEKRMQDRLSSAYRELSESHQRLKDSQEQLIQAEKLSSLGQLAASIAHEVNNPLGGILTYDQLLIRKTKEGTLTTETSLDYLSKMERELTRSTKLIRNLLDFARQSPAVFRPVNVNEVLDRAYELAAHAAKLQRINVVTQFEEPLPTVQGDSDQLQQVFTNLIVNALQSMKEGGTLTLRTANRKDDVAVDICDTGCGISPENMGKLFTPFFTTKREVKGVGLGLAVSYGIVQRHKGRIDVKSKVDEGTTMSVVLPVAVEAAPAVEQGGTSAPA